MYNETFEWISGACNKAVDCLSRLVEVPENDTTDSSILINAVTSSPTDSQTIHTYSKTNAPVMMPSGNTKVNALQPIMRDHRDTLIQMKGMALFCKHISRWQNDGKTHHHESNTFTHIDWLLYKHAMDASQKFLMLVIPGLWSFMVLVEAHDKLGHQGVVRNYHLIKKWFYWKIWHVHYAGGKKQKHKCIPYRWQVYQSTPLIRSP